MRFLQPGSDKFEVVPNSELVVNRTAYKNNSNKYSINDKSSSYKEVQTLLKGRGIDLDHNRFLILQVRKFANFIGACLTASRVKSSPSLR